MRLEEYYEIIERSHPVLRYCERFDQDSEKWIITKHSHPYLELIFFLEGKAAMSVAGANLQASMYDTLVYPANVAHHDRLNNDMSCEIVCLWVDIPELVLENPILMHERDREIRELFLLIYNEYWREPRIPYLIEHAIKILLMTILRNQSEMPEREQFLSEIIPYIDRHYNEKITLEALASREHISKSYLTRRFRQFTGTTIVTYINKRRIEAARELLIHSSFNTTEIAYQVGFESPKYFHRVFKKETGASPASFRKAYRQEHRAAP